MALLAEQRDSQIGGTDTSTGIPADLNEEGSHFNIGSRTTSQTQSIGGGIGGGLDPTRPVEPGPGPGITPPGATPTQPPEEPPPSGSLPWAGGQTPPPGSTGSGQDPLARPGSTRSRHDTIGAADPSDPDNWAYGLEWSGQNSFYDPRTGMYYDRFGKKIKPSHTGPVGSEPYDPGDGTVYPPPGSAGPGQGTSWGVNPMDWFGENMEIAGSPSVSLEGMLLGPHEAQQSENVTVGPMSQAGATTAPYTDLSGLVGAGQGDIDSGAEAQASGYDAHTQEVDPTKTASGQMDEITGKDSPLMQRAQQEGILMAARRGLSNSSIAAGAAMGAMVDRAQPLALANAQQYAQQDLANQAALNAASQFNSTWDNQMEQLNKQIRSQEAITGAQIGLEGEVAAAQIRSAESQFNAELQTRNEQFNAQWANQAQMLQAELSQQNNQFNAAQQNQIDSHIMQMNTALNEQYLRGSQALDLATLQGQFSTLIANNQTAGQLFSTHLQSIGQVMANDQISPATIASYVEIQQNILQQMLQLMADMDNIQFGDALEPGTAPEGAPGTGGGIDLLQPGMRP